MSFRMRRGRLSLSASGRGVRGGYRLGYIVPLAVIVVVATWAGVH